MFYKWKMLLGLFAVSFAFAQDPVLQQPATAAPAAQPAAAPAPAPTQFTEAPAPAPSSEVTASDGKGTTVSVFVKSP